MSAAATRVRFGVDALIAAPAPLAGARLGMLTNDAARTAADPALRSRTALQRAGLSLVRLFSPEHGLGARAPDGAAVGDARDALTGLPVVSLYGERLRPTPEALAGLDALLFDVPDVGARFYTYLWTLSHLLDACAEARLPLYLLDRPNPLGGRMADAEGPLLQVERFGSFLGRAAIPIRHGLTAGEFARLWQREHRPEARLHVVPATGWRREDLWPATGLPWIPTSPAMPDFLSALLYPGLCLFEATNLSVGRGTSTPFRWIGAPWLDGAALARRLERCALPGVRAEPQEITPAQAPHAGQRCGGVRLVIEDAARVRPVALGLRLLAEVRALSPAHFAWATYPTVANPTGKEHFERLLGRAGVRERLEDENHPVDDETLREWTATPGWSGRVRGVLLYD